MTRIPAWAMLATIAAFRVATDVHAAAVQANDDAGHRVALAAPAQRIVSLAPHATELLFAAGAGAHVVAVLKGSDAPAEARRLPRIGDVAGLDLERIVALSPDLVVTWPYTTPGQVALLRERGIAVFMTDAHEPEDIARDLEALGILAGTESTAAPAARALRERAAAITRARAGRRTVRVFYQIASAPIFTIGGGHLIDHALARCGGVNVFGDTRVPAPQVDVEAVLARKPDVIIAATVHAARPAWLDDWSRWRDLPAARTQSLFVVDADRLHRAGPRFVDGMAELCEALDRARARVGG